MTFNHRFIDACNKKPVDMVPAWYMRQAGRYQTEYQEIRKQYSLLEICRHPEVCAEVTKLPVRQLGVDAAILFSDIMVPLAPMGVAFDIKESIGPVLEQPIRTREDIERLQSFDPEISLPHVLDTIRILKADLDVPLIGFTGAPFTLASYMIEGGPSRHYIRTKQMMYENPEGWKVLMDKLGDMIVTYLSAQVASGSAAFQLFDSWVGSLAPNDYEEYVLPTMQRIFSELAHLHVPMIYFGVGTGELLTLMANTGATVLGIDWRVPLPEARKRIGLDIAVQGNLDPALLFAPWSEIERRVRDILDAGMEHEGFIFNLGWGVLHHRPTVNPETLARLTAFVHEYSAKH